MASTVCLPFAVSAEQAAAAGKFYSFAGVDTSGSDWVVTMQETDPSNQISGELATNTPYLFMPDADGAVSFSGTMDVPTDASTVQPNAQAEIDGWQFVGTFSRIDWSDDPQTIYGFAAQAATSTDDSHTAIAAGTFVLVAGGPISYIVPFRAYQQYTGSNHSRAMSRAAQSVDLPAQMTVRLISANGQTTAIGTLDTRTGEAIFGTDDWHTLDGRKLDGKPTQKGIYINKGKKITIK